MIHLSTNTESDPLPRCGSLELEEDVAGSRLGRGLRDSPFEADAVGRTEWCCDGGSSADVLQVLLITKHSQRDGADGCDLQRPVAAAAKAMLRENLMMYAHAYVNAPLHFVLRRAYDRKQYRR